MMLKGIATSSGIAIGKVYKLEQPNVVVSEKGKGPQEELKIFDYGSCPFPEGIIDSKYSVGFNHEDIEQIVYEGYQDEEQKEFTQVLADSSEELKQKFAEEVAKQIKEA